MNRPFIAELLAGSLPRLRDPLDPETAVSRRRSRLRGDHVVDARVDVPEILRNAAVLVPLIDHPGGMNVLLTLRTAGLPHHAGQVAFPGGRLDDTDRDPVHTALREAEEEIGLPPGNVDIVGRLDDYITGTGYATAAFDTWGSFAMPMFLMLMFVGGCAGSTTCGIKIFRFQVLYSAARSQLSHLLQPHGVFVPYYNQRPIPEEVIVSVLSFFFLFGLILALLSMGLGLIGLDFVTALSGAASALSNVGPGLGPTIGPAGTYQTLPDAAKWLLCAGMLLGRLELFTVLVMLSPNFWRG